MNSARMITAAVLGLAAWAAPARAEKALPLFDLDEVKVAGLPRLPDANIPPVPPPTDTGYYSPAGIRVDSSVKVIVEGSAGRVEIELPRAAAGPVYSASLFIRFAAVGQPELSWAAVVCSGGRYLGYKGATLRLPAGEEGEITLRDDAYSLGPMKGLVGRTHPWLVKGAGGAEDLDRLCAPGLASRLKAFSPRALPRSAAGYDFLLAKGGKLTLSWGARRP
jgi:hypothetical protein